MTLEPDRPGALADYARFVVERAPVSSIGCAPIGVVGSYTEVADRTPAQDADPARAGFQYVDEPGAGCFRYRGSGVVDGQRGPGGESGNVSSAPPSN